MCLLLLWASVFVVTLSLTPTPLLLFLFDILLFLVSKPGQRCRGSQLSSSSASCHPWFAFRLLPILQLHSCLHIIPQRNSIDPKFLPDPPLLPLRICQARPCSSFAALPLSLPPTSTPERPATQALSHYLSLHVPRTLVLSTKHRFAPPPEPIPRIPFPPQLSQVSRVQVPHLPKRPRMIHLHAMRQLMHHNHLHTTKRQPMTRVRCSEY